MITNIININSSSVGWRSTDILYDGIRCGGRNQLNKHVCVCMRSRARTQPLIRSFDPNLPANSKGNTFEINDTTLIIKLEYGKLKELRWRAHNNKRNTVSEAPKHNPCLILSIQMVPWLFFWCCYLFFVFLLFSLCFHVRLSFCLSFFLCNVQRLNLHSMFTFRLSFIPFIFRIQRKCAREIETKKKEQQHKSIRPIRFSGDRIRIDDWFAVFLFLLILCFECTHLSSAL